MMKNTAKIMYVKIISCNDPVDGTVPLWYYDSIGKIVKVYKKHIQSHNGFNVYKIVDWKKVVPIKYHPKQIHSEEAILIQDCVEVYNHHRGIRGIRKL